MLYNVKYKGFSVGLTTSLKEALEWKISPDHKIHCIRVKQS